MSAAASRRRFAPVLLVLFGLASACAKGPQAWKSDLSDADPFVRGMAAIGLALAGPAHVADALPELLRTIDATHVGLEREAAFVLSRVGPTHAPALLEVLVGVELPTEDRKGAIKNALVAGGAEVVPAIVKCMRGPGSQRVGDLGDVLLAIGAPAAPELADLLNQEADVRLRRFAAFLLGRLGPRGVAARGALEAALADEDPELRAVAAAALRAMGPGSLGGGAR